MATSQTVSIDVPLELAARIHALAQEIVDRRLLEPGTARTPAEAGLSLDAFVHNALASAIAREEQALRAFDRYQGDSQRAIG